jgi:mannose-6-phosphate isomerase class I
LKPRQLQILAVTAGAVAVQSDSTTVDLSAGQFCLVPAALERTEVRAASEAALLYIQAN